MTYNFIRGLVDPEAHAANSIYAAHAGLYGDDVVPEEYKMTATRAAALLLSGVADQGEGFMPDPAQFPGSIRTLHKAVMEGRVSSRDRLLQYRRMFRGEFSSVLNGLSAEEKKGTSNLLRELLADKAELEQAEVRVSGMRDSMQWDSDSRSFYSSKPDRRTLDAAEGINSTLSFAELINAEEKGEVDPRTDFAVMHFGVPKPVQEESKNSEV